MQKHFTIYLPINPAHISAASPWTYWAPPAKSVIHTVVISCASVSDSTMAAAAVATAAAAAAAATTVIGSGSSFEWTPYHVGAIFVVPRSEGVGMCSDPWSFVGRLTHLSVLDFIVVFDRQRMTQFKRPKNLSFPSHFLPQPRPDVAPTSDQMLAQFQSSPCRPQ